jgi:hypothetical protein
MMADFSDEKFIGPEVEPVAEVPAEVPAEPEVVEPVVELHEWPKRNSILRGVAAMHRYRGDK